MTQSSPGLQTIRKVVVVTNINLQYTDFSQFQVRMHAGMTTSSPTIVRLPCAHSAACFLPAPIFGRMDNMCSRSQNMMTSFPTIVPLPCAHSAACFPTAPAVGRISSALCSLRCVFSNRPYSWAHGQHMQQEPEPCRPQPPNRHP